MKTVPSLLVQSPFLGMQISGLNPPVAIIVITHACMWYILKNSLTFACVQSSWTGKGLKLKLVLRVHKLKPTSFKVQVSCCRSNNIYPLLGVDENK